jgi:signal transduction histidine kinase
MTSMLENVSLIGKEQSGRLSFRPEILNLHELITQIVEESHLTLNQSNRIDVVMESDFTNVLIDQVLLRHILINLLTNALKYSPGKPNVHFSIKQVKRYLEFTISDFGVGIPESDIPNVFEPFYRATNSEDFKGTGLGLSIVKQCVGIHGGEIFLESKLGTGTIVKVLLPLRHIKV